MRRVLAEAVSSGSPPPDQSSRELGRARPVEGRLGTRASPTPGGLRQSPPIAGPETITSPSTHIRSAPAHPAQAQAEAQAQVEAEAGSEPADPRERERDSDNSTIRGSAVARLDALTSVRLVR